AARHRGGPDTRRHDDPCRCRRRRDDPGQHRQVRGVSVGTPPAGPTGEAGYEAEAFEPRSANRRADWGAWTRTPGVAPTSARTLSASLSKSEVTFSFGNCSTSVLPRLPARTRSIPAERISAIDVSPVVSSMSATDTPLLARLTTSDSRSWTPSS